MYQLLRVISREDLARRQLPSFLIAFGVASFAYKFGSFALECVAFLATWFVLDGFASFALAALTPPSERTTP